MDQREGGINRAKTGDGERHGYLGVRSVGQCLERVEVKKDEVEWQDEGKSRCLTLLKASLYMACTALTSHSSIPSFHIAHQIRGWGTLSKAFSLSTKVKYRSLFLVKYFSFSCLANKIASIVLLPGTTPNCILSRLTSSLVTSMGAPYVLWTLVHFTGHQQSCLLHGISISTIYAPPAQMVPSTCHQHLSWSHFRLDWHGFSSTTIWLKSLSLAIASVRFNIWRLITTLSHSSCTYLFHWFTPQLDTSTVLLSSRLHLMSLIPNFSFKTLYMLSM